MADHQETRTDLQLSTATEFFRRLSIELLTPLNLPQETALRRELAATVGGLARASGTLIEATRGAYRSTYLNSSAQARLGFYACDIDSTGVKAPTGRKLQWAAELSRTGIERSVYCDITGSIISREGLLNTEVEADHLPENPLLEFHRSIGCYLIDQTELSPE